MAIIGLSRRGKQVDFGTNRYFELDGKMVLRRK